MTTAAQIDWSAKLGAFRPYLRGLARGRLRGQLRSRADSSDLVQETLQVAYQSIHDFHGHEPGQMARWLATILEHRARNLTRDAHRGKRDARVERSLDESIEDSAARLEALGTAGDARTELFEVLDALNTLPEPECDAVVMHLIGDTLQEIAAALEVSPATAARRLHEGLKKLRHRLEGVWSR